MHLRGAGETVKVAGTAGGAQVVVVVGVTAGSERDDVVHLVGDSGANTGSVDLADATGSSENRCPDFVPAAP